MDKTQKLYEVAYLITPAYSEEEAQNFQQSLKNGLQDLGGKIDPSTGGEGGVIKRRLFYPIEKLPEAYLANFRFLLAPEKINTFKNKLATKEVLRFLLIETRHRPARIYQPRITKIVSEIISDEKPKTPSFKEIIPQPKSVAPEQPAANIEEIDKRLEEILGK